MSIRKEDWPAINQAIADAILPLKPRGWRKALFLLRDWSVLGTVATLIVALLALAGAGWNYAFSRIDKQARFEENTTSKLAQIDTTLSSLQNSITLLQAQVANSQYSNLSKKDLSTHRQELQNIKDALAKTPNDTPNFWPTSLRLINLLSQSIASVEPTGATITLDGISGYRPNLIGHAPGTRIILKGLIQDSLFQSEVIILDPNVRFVNVSFLNCILILPTDANPTPNIKKIGEALLASDLSQVKITAG
jgi:hypothetical protein